MLNNPSTSLLKMFVSTTYFIYDLTVTASKSLVEGTLNLGQKLWVNISC